MNVIKRSGEEVVFDPQKIFNAVSKANTDVSEDKRIPETYLKAITESVVAKCNQFSRAVHVEEIQDIVEKEIMSVGYYDAAKAYVIYRYQRAQARKENSTDDAILALVECHNEEVKQENSNKNPIIASTQRDYMAGEVSKDLSRRVLLPPDVVKAHDEGLIHFHDMDFFNFFF